MRARSLDHARRETSFLRYKDRSAWSISHNLVSKFLTPSRGNLNHSSLRNSTSLSRLMKDRFLEVASLIYQSFYSGRGFTWSTTNYQVNRGQREGQWGQHRKGMFESHRWISIRIGKISSNFVTITRLKNWCRLWNTGQKRAMLLPVVSKVCQLLCTW